MKKRIYTHSLIKVFLYKFKKTLEKTQKNHIFDIMLN